MVNNKQDLLLYVVNAERFTNNSAHEFLSQTANGREETLSCMELLDQFLRETRKLHGCGSARVAWKIILKKLLIAAQDQVLNINSVKSCTQVKQTPSEYVGRGSKTWRALLVLINKSRGQNWKKRRHDKVALYWCQKYRYEVTGAWYTIHWKGNGRKEEGKN